MWDKAVDRQYNLFGTLLMFLVTAVSVVGTILGSSSYYLSSYQKVLFSTLSLVSLSSIIALLRMAHVERRIGFMADTPKNVDKKLQQEENRLRYFVNISIGTTVFLILLLVNIIIWSR